MTTGDSLGLFAALLAGNDLINGSSAADTLMAFDGDDRIDGATGSDRMIGGAGNDTYIADSSEDAASETVDGGTDTVLSSASFFLGTWVENLTLTGTASVNANGNALDNVLTGNSGENFIDGQGGADRMIGGGGNDTYVVDNPLDRVVEVAGGGADTVSSSVSYVLGANLEALELTGTGAINGTGNGLANRLVGNSGANILNGGAGADTMFGGAGSDTYIVDNAGDALVDTGGIDTVKSPFSFTLGGSLDNLVLLGTGALDGTGNSLANTLTGTAAANVLTGGGGDDLLDGKAGTDRLVGGVGDDIFVVDRAADVVVELAGEGSDTIESSVTRVLEEFVEKLVLTGAAPINGTGNALANTLVGNAGANRLDGRSGVDQMSGGAGNDTYIVDVQGDIVREALGGGTDIVLSSASCFLADWVENLTLTGTASVTAHGNGLSNVIRGNAGANFVDGHGGADTMIGGGGNDTYMVDDGLDAVIELAGGGADTVMSAVSFTLGANVENLELTSNAVNATGNTLANTLLGNSFANVLNGGAGADVMSGRGGNDTYVVDSAGDQVIESSGNGIDTVNSALGWILASNVENLVLTGTRAINGAGNALANSLTGNSAANRLDGGAGIDTMTGGDGNDTYIVDDEDDAAIETSAAGGIDSVWSSADFTLGANVENLVLTGTLAINGGGNALANSLTGNAAANALDGKTGADVMKGGDGDDFYWVDDPGDLVIETRAVGGMDSVRSSVSFTLGAWVEKLELVGGSAIDGTGNGLANDLTGNAAANILDGGLGRDVMRGGGGNDTYRVDNVGDQAIETGASAGLDLVTSSVTFTLSDFVDNLVLIGTAAIDGTGNGLNNALTGNGAANRLDGGGGVDRMEGGDGNDIYVADHVHDRAIETSAAGGTDAVVSSLDFKLDDFVENLTLVGSANAGGIGNSLDNAITGNAGANRLDGNEGVDTIDGGAGADAIHGGRGSDLLTGGAGADAFYIDTALGSDVDQILDFSAADDTLMLKFSLFAGLAPGPLPPGAFYAGPAAHDGNDRIVYDATTGNLFYDPDGTGAAAAILFAQVAAGTTLTHADFVLI